LALFTFFGKQFFPWTKPNASSLLDTGSLGYPNCGTCIYSCTWFVRLPDFWSSRDFWRNKILLCSPNECCILSSTVTNRFSLGFRMFFIKTRL